MSARYVRTFASMGTTVTIRVEGSGDTPALQYERELAVDHAVEWFAHVEAACNRFDSRSELSRLCAAPGTPVAVSATLFEALQFALAVARASDGAFDPTVGAALERNGFDRNYRSGDVVHSGVTDDRTVSWHDVSIDASARTVTLEKPMLLDLGAVAKGLAIDMAAQTLARFNDFSVDAGGDLYVGGHNADGHSWAVGIRDPRQHERMLEVVRLSNSAVCTSGDYARRSPSGHHLVQPRTGRSVSENSSVTVIAPSALIADALSTAAFVLGPHEGVTLLEQHEVEGLFVTSDGQRVTTHGWPAGALQHD